MPKLYLYESDATHMEIDFECTPIIDEDYLTEIPQELADEYKELSERMKDVQNKLRAIKG